MRIKGMDIKIYIKVDISFQNVTFKNIWLRERKTDDFVRQWLHIGEVDNGVIVLWVSTSNPCTAASRPSRQKHGDTTFHVEGGNGYLYPRMGL